MSSLLRLMMLLPGVMLFSYYCIYVLYIPLLFGAAGISVLSTAMLSEFYLYNHLHINDSHYVFYPKGPSPGVDSGGKVMTVEATLVLYICLYVFA